jgi:hypothetical protein
VALTLLLDPEVRPHSVIVLTDQTRIEGSYVTSDSNSVLLRFQERGEPPRPLILRRSDAPAGAAGKGPYVLPAARSLFGWIVGTDFTCFPPDRRTARRHSSLF